MQRIERTLGISANARPLANGRRFAAFLAVALAASEISNVAASDKGDESHSRPEAQSRRDSVDARGAGPKAVGKRLEATSNRLKAAVAKGEMTEDEAWAGWYATKNEIIKTALEAGEISEAQAADIRDEMSKAELSERLEAAGSRIRAAAVKAELGEDDAWSEWHATSEKLIADALEAGEISDEVAAAYRHELNKAEVDERLSTAGWRIKAAVANGEMTEEDAWAEWYATRDEIIASAVEAGRISTQNAARLQREIHKAELSERLSTAGKRIKAAFNNGELTEEQAWAEWNATQEDLLTEAFKAGEVSENVAAAYRRDIEKAEAGQKLKAAVAKGEMTEEETFSGEAPRNPR